jgi:hypothetical protein
VRTLAISRACVSNYGKAFGVSGNINLAWLYIQAPGIGSEHADGVQCYSLGSTGTVTVKNSTFKMAGSATAGYFSADNWQGSHVFGNVLFEGAITDCVSRQTVAQR